ncbi:MAG TPA: OmpA family protein [Pseudobdellovibrionaceae bacterium]|jgi:outer membrane protein OmpA-like peptidoglycan-associated protein
MVTKSMAISLTIVSLFASLTMAADPQTSVMGIPTTGSMNVHDPVGWFPFIGISGGYMSPDDDLRTEGSPGDLKIIGSYFSENKNNVIDIGLGFMGDSFTQKSDTQNNFISGGVAELAWRYNWSNRWQFGVAADTFIGGGDRYGSTDPNLTSFGGLQLIKEMPIKNSNMFRIGLKGLTSLSIPSKSINTVMLDLQWGFGNEQKGPEVGANARPSGSDIGAPTGVSPDLESGGALTAGATLRRVEVDPADNSLIVRNDAHMQFDSGSTTLSSMNADYIERLGRALAQRQDLFDRVEVVALVDQSGSSRANVNTSRARSQQVSRHLTQGGLSKNKIQTTWKRSSDPMYKSLLPEEMQQSNRVDLRFRGVKDPGALQELLANP